MKTRELDPGEREGYAGLEPFSDDREVMCADCEVEGFYALAIADGAGIGIVLTVGFTTVEWFLEEDEAVVNDLLEALPTKLSLAQLQLLGFTRIS